MEARYPVRLEVCGAFAMFARPDSGGAPTSYPVPTWSAAKGIFESIAFLSDGRAWIDPVKVEVCRRVGESGGMIRFQRYTTNYGGPLRKSDLLKKGVAAGGSSMQVFATILSDVCYRLHGAIVGPKAEGGTNARHYLQDLFQRRLLQGRCFRTPVLGWREFTPSYWGPFRCRKYADGSENEAWSRLCTRFGRPFEDCTEVDEALTIEIPSMLQGMWSRATSGAYSPDFRQNACIESGVLSYDDFGAEYVEMEALDVE
jgi:CRISPR-associated protein Cas5d